MKSNDFHDGNAVKEQEAIASPEIFYIQLLHCNQSDLMFVSEQELDLDDSVRGA